MSRHAKQEIQPTPVISLEYSPAMQLVIAADSAGPRPAKPEYLARTGGENLWRKRATERVCAFEIADLDLLFAPVSTSLFLTYLVILDEKHRISEFIDALARMTDADFSERFRRLFYQDEQVAGWTKPAALEAALERDRARETIPFAEEAAQMSRLLAFPTVYRRKLVEVLTWFNERVFMESADAVGRDVTGWIEEYRATLASDPVPILNSLTKGNYETLLQPVPAIRVFPVVDGANGDMSLLLPGDAYLVFGVAWARERLERSVDVREAERATDEMIEALADPKRVAMLRLLRLRPHYGREIADRLEISASTVSYHLDKLVTAGLAVVQLSSGRRFYYALHEEGFRELAERIVREFAGSGEGG